MKRFFASLLFLLALGGSAGAGPSASYINYGVVLKPPVIDATTFVNLGPFEFSVVITETNLTAGVGTLLTGIPYETRDTKYYTNQNTMSASPGFRFDTSTAGTRHNAISFFNSGTITGVDTPGGPFVETYQSTTAAIPYPPYSFPLPSQLLVLASNIVNQGTMEVGTVGLIQLTGQNVNLANGALIAGAVSDTDTNDLTGQQSTSFEEVNGHGFIVDPPEVYDLWWGATNGETMFVANFEPPFQPVADVVGIRGYAYLGAIALPVNFPLISSTILGTFEPFFYAYALDPTGTNLYYNMVFLNTNFIDTNITASVGFTGPFAAQQIPEGDPAGLEAVIQFSEPVQDVISGQMVTNSVYFMDAGAAVRPMGTNINCEYTQGYSRPNTFEITTVTPIDWLDSTANGINWGGILIPYDIGYIYAPNSYMNNKVTMTNASYAAQIGRNPENADGAFSIGVGAVSLNISSGFFDLPDMTNEPARIEVNAGSLNLKNARFRAEGVVTLNGSNVVGSAAASDWGNVNAALSATNGTLLVSNIFPATFKRIRGDVYAWTVDWMNVYTNGVTNTIHYHVLILDQNLQGSFKSSIRSLSLRATNVVVQDTLRVVNGDIFTASNLTFNGAVTLTQNAGNAGATNFPNLKNLLVGTNGSLTVDSLLNLGYPVSLVQSGPVGRKYSILSLTNFGAIVATAPLLQAQSIENDGSITATNGGSMIVNANSIGLSQAGINATVIAGTNTYVVGQSNYLRANGTITLSAASLLASNSTIQAGLGGLGSLNLDVTTLLSDHVPNTPTTNSVLVNFWQTTAGFTLTTNPTARSSSSLFGTQIKSIVTGHNVANHVWAGKDGGPTAAGYASNVVIGRLVLDRQTNSAILHFSGAGKSNAMYVDYLELDDYSYSDYRNGLEIDPNLTIYFADSNADPIKLGQIYPGRLIWASNFFGPNSTAEIVYTNGHCCRLNAALRDSTETIDGNGIPYAYDPYPPCPTVNTNCQDIPAPASAAPHNLVVTVIGQGTITPQLQAGAQAVIGSTYTFTASPAAGWVFQGWTGTYPTANAAVTFTMQPAVASVNLTANFIVNPFPAVAGVYNGLFAVPGAVAAGSSGFFTFSVNSSGAFSGKLQMGPASCPFSGKFNGDGSGSVTAKNGSNTLTVALQLDTAQASGQVSGSVNGPQWNASLSGNRAPAWTAQNPAPQQGRYTMLLPGQIDEPSLPGGDSYGSAVVSAAGTVTLAGTLADGVAISQAVPVSEAGLWPLYAYGAAGKDTVLGWATFATNASGGSDVNGSVNWMKAAGTGHYYPNGFSLPQQLFGTLYTPPAAHADVLSLSSGSLILSSGNLAQNLTNTIALENHVTYSSSNGSVTLSINPATGGFSGSFVWPGTHKTTSIGGVVLQSGDSAGGFFLGTNQSGAVRLQNN